MVDVDGSCQFSADSQPKSTGLIWEFAATRRSVYIHQMNWVNSRNDFGHDEQHHKRCRGYIINKNNKRLAHLVAENGKFEILFQLIKQTIKYQQQRQLQLQRQGTHRLRTAPTVRCCRLMSQLEYTPCPMEWKHKYLVALKNSTSLL